MPSDQIQTTTKVGLVQIGELTWTRRQRQQWSMKNGQPILKPTFAPPASLVYLPYSVGLLQAYVQKYSPQPERYEFLLPIYQPLAVAEAVEQLRGAHVVGFSVYVWNIRLSLAIARALKSLQPDMVIVFGGPQVPDHPEQFLRDNPFVDLVCHGEGEQVFLSILENLPTRSWELTPSISYLRPDGTCIHTPPIPRLKELSVIPSPYLEGVFDPLMAANPQHRWLVMWETNRGCPFSCSFCDWGSAVASKVNRFDMERLRAEIEWFAQRRINHVFVCDANFGILPRDLEIAEYLVEVSRKYRNYLAISVQNAKNATERTYQIQKTLSQIISAGVTLSMQSTNPDTLRNIKRDNISLASFNELQRRYTRDGINTYTDIILGLPGDTYDTLANGVSQLLENGQHNRISFYNCSILPNAEMGDPAYQKRFGLVHVPVPIIHEYDSLERTAQIEVQEYIDTVVATNSMPPEAWRRTKVFSWMTELLHFNRLLQVVFVVLNRAYGIPYRDLVEAFTTADTGLFPVMAEINAMLEARALANQRGEPEYMPEEGWLKVWWPMHQYAFIWVAIEGKLDAFYSEAETILGNMLAARLGSYDPVLLQEAVSLNRHMIRVPFIFKDVSLPLTYNVWEFYRQAVHGDDAVLNQGVYYHRLNRTSTVWLTWESWCEDIVMREYRRSDYFYTVEVDTQSPLVDMISAVSSSESADI